ncbi:hypothetical protein [Vibrio phage vB_pir03]|nr:hypothetical protein [Vibrio phage vB_pir03]
MSERTGRYGRPLWVVRTLYLFYLLRICYEQK